MTYKLEGHGLQADGICQKGYTYQMFMCTYRTPKTYLAKSLSPLHARGMALFHNVE